MVVESKTHCSGELWLLLEVSALRTGLFFRVLWFVEEEKERRSWKSLPQCSQAWFLSMATFALYLLRKSSWKRSPRPLKEHMETNGQPSTMSTMHSHSSTLSISARVS